MGRYHFAYYKCCIVKYVRQNYYARYPSRFTIKNDRFKMLYVHTGCKN